MHRVAVIGPAGSGKTTLARCLAEVLGLTHIELDALFHLSNWEQSPAPEFVAAVQVAMEDASRDTGGWVMCGEYNSRIDHIRSPAADTIVWLDLPRLVVTIRVVKRTLKRVIWNQELWNGNREQVSNLFSLDKDKNVVWWAWSVYHKRRDESEQRNIDGTWTHADVVRLRSRSQVRRWLAQVDGSRRTTPRLSRSRSRGRRGL